MTCPNCDHQQTDDDVTVCTECGTPMSVASDSLDKLVEGASIPNLAALFQAGKNSGVIKTQVEYGFTP